MMKTIYYICSNNDGNKVRVYLSQYNEIRYDCRDRTKYTPFSRTYEDGCFQTPPRGHENYKDSYQDMHYIVGYAQLKYSSDKKSCTINFITKVNPILGTCGTDYDIYYKFGDKPEQQNINSIILNSNVDKYPNGMAISDKIKTNDDKEYKLELEDEYFM